MPGEDFIEQSQALAIEHKGELDRVQVAFKLPIEFLRNYMLIYRAYAPFVIETTGDWTGPTDRNTTFLRSQLTKSNGVHVFMRKGHVNIPGTWTDIMLAANTYMWPAGELIRDYLVVLSNAINAWGWEEADRNKTLPGLFTNVIDILHLAEHPRFDTTTEVREWLLQKNNPLMLSLARYTKFSDLNLQIDTARKVFHALDDEVLKHCSQMRIFKKKNNIKALAKTFRRARGS